MQAYVDGNQVGNRSYGDHLSCTINTNNLSAGTHTVKVNAVDNAGNVGDDSVDIVIVTEAGTTDPKVDESSDKGTLPKVTTTLILSVGSPNLYVNGKRAKIDSNNDSVVPVSVNGRVLVPIALAKAFGATLNWNSATSTAEIYYGSKKMLVTARSNTMIMVESSKTSKATMETPAEMREGRLYLHVRVLADVLGTELAYTDGIIIIGANASNPNADEVAKFKKELYQQEWKRGNATLYNHGDVKELVRQERLYVTDSYGNIYKKTFKSDGTTDDRQIDVPKESGIEYRAKSVYFSGDPSNKESKLKLYLNKPEKDELVSIIPEKLSWVNAQIHEQQVILNGAKNACDAGTIQAGTKTQIQEAAQKRLEALQKLRKGIFTDEYRQYSSKSFKVDETSDAAQIYEIQAYLAGCYSSQKLTGDYDAVTFNNVAYFQITQKEKYNVDVTGYVDEQTYSLLVQAHNELKPEEEEQQKQQEIDQEKKAKIAGYYEQLAYRQLDVAHMALKALNIGAISRSTYDEVIKGAARRVQSYEKAVEGDTTGLYYDNNAYYLLKEGSSGEYVTQIQKILRDYLGQNVQHNTDGNYGYETWRNIAYLQIIMRENSDL